jgi:hypothetical protein
MGTPPEWLRSYHAGYLQEKFPICVEDENLIINGSLIPDKQICERILALNLDEALLFNGELVAARLNEARFESLIGEEEVSGAGRN